MSSRPKVLHIISAWERGYGSELAEFATRSSHEFESEICVLAALGLRWTCDVSTYLGVRRVLRRFRPDVIHTWDATAHSYAAAYYGTKCILAEKQETDAPKGLFQKCIDQRTARFIVPRPNDALPTAKTVVIAPAVVPVPQSEPMQAEKLLEKLGVPLVEPSGDYYPVFQPQYEPTRLNYKSLPPRQTPFLIGIMLPLCLEHRILDALWVFETLNYVHLNYHAFIIGDGKDRETFLRCRDRWKLFSRVHFLGNRHDTPKLLPHFDVLLHLSSSPEYSGAVLSAMSCGVPVVALETSESREYIADGTTGILVPAEGDFRFYRRTAVKRILYLSENEELRQSMSIAAKDRIAKKFNFDTAVQRRMDVYREWIGGPARPPLR